MFNHLGDQSNDGRYTINAKNKWGKCDSSAHLNVVLCPEIEGPHDVRVTPGEPVEFVALVHANPPPKVAW